jgi:hypothetical protein
MHTYMQQIDSARIYIYVSIFVEYTCIYGIHFLYVHILCVRFTDDKDYEYPDWHKYIARKMTDWYKVFPLATGKAVVEVDVEAEEVQEGYVVDTLAVVAGGA